MKISYRQRRQRQSLELFLRRISEKVSVEKAMKNIEQSIVSLSYDREHYAAGILLTRNGYFMTAYHCLHGFDAYDLITKMKVRASDGSIGEVEEICSFVEEQDLVLGKVRICVSFQPKIYPILDEPQEKCPVVILSKWGREMRRRYGVLAGVSQEDYASMGSQKFLHNNHFIVNTEVENGDSGGLIVAQDTGALIGVVSSSTNEFSKEPHLTYCGRASNIRDLIERYNKQ